MGSTPRPLQPPPPLDAASIAEAEAEAEAEADAMFYQGGGGGCCCFSLPCFPGRSSPSSEWWDRERRAAGDGGGADGAWWRRGLMKAREWSELVAGPRWKTFIRRFSRRARGRRGWRRFQYDPLSYALNFDEGRPLDESPDGDAYLDFSTRFAVLPGTAKSGGVDEASMSAAPSGGGAASASASAAAAAAH